jgi:hypothetical protein
MQEIPAFLAMFSAFCFDYLVRQKIGGVNLNLFMVEQLPVLPPNDVRPANISRSPVTAAAVASWSGGCERAWCGTAPWSSARTMRSACGRISIMHSSIAVI